MKKYDLHLHTSYSKCSTLKPKELLKIAKARKLDGIAITDHDTIKGALEVKKLNKDPDFEVIIGEEIQTDKGEILAYYLKKEIKPGKAEDVIKKIKKQNAICSIAHPFTFGIRKRSKIDLTKTKVDAVETFNSRSLTPFENKKAKQLATKHNLAETGGSDSHFTWGIGEGYTLFEKDLKQAVKSRKTKAQGKTSFSLIDRPLSVFVKAWRILF